MQKAKALARTIVSHTIPHAWHLPNDCEATVLDSLRGRDEAEVIVRDPETGDKLLTIHVRGH